MSTSIYYLKYKCNLNVSESVSHFNTIAKDYDYWKNKNKKYYNKLNSILSTEIPDTSKVLDFGCGTGTLLNNLPARLKVGYDPSIEMIGHAREKFPEVNWINKIPKNKFD